MQNYDLSKLEVQKEFCRAAHSSVAQGRVPDFFLISNFDRSQFCSPLSYDDEKWLIWEPQSIGTFEDILKGIKSDTMLLLS